MHWEGGCTGYCAWGGWHMDIIALLQCGYISLVFLYLYWSHGMKNVEDHCSDWKKPSRIVFWGDTVDISAEEKGAKSNFMGGVLFVVCWIKTNIFPQYLLLSLVFLFQDLHHFQTKNFIFCWTSLPSCRTIKALEFHWLSPFMRCSIYTRNYLINISNSYLY